MTLEKMPIEYLTCRTFGHAWEEFVPVGMRRPSHGFRISLLCVRCGMERHDLADTNGYVHDDARNYRAPDGYALDYRITRAEARVVYNRRRRRRDLPTRDA